MLCEFSITVSETERQNTPMITILNSRNRKGKIAKSRFNNPNTPVKMRTATLFFPIITLVLILSGCSFHVPAADALSDASGHMDHANNSSSPNTAHPGPVTEYLRVSKLVPEADTALLESEPALNPYPDLSVPTYLTKVDDTYFLVDCYHNQVIYHDNLEDPLSMWKVLTNEIDRGHTLASDGDVYLIDDTEQNRILIFEQQEERYVHTQTFSEIGTRPHYIIYDDATDTFYAWSSMTGEMYLFRHDPDDTRMYLTEIRKIESLDHTYVRSFTIIGNDIYFVSGNSSILCADLASFEITAAYPVPASMAGMIQLTKIQDYFYLTISTDASGSQDYATIIRTHDLSSLEDGGYEDIYDYFIGGGTPYYLTEADNAYYLTEHRLPGHSLWRFQVEDNEIVQVEPIY